MSSAQNLIYPPPGAPAGFASNGGGKRYLIEVESTTGFVAWRLDDGTTLINQAENVDLPASRSLTFWPCVGCEDATPAGDITSLDCHANELVSLDVRQLKTLRFLDCCYNRLTELDLTGLADLEVLDVDNNRLASLDVLSLRSLRVFNCANNRLAQLDVSLLTKLQVFDSSGNPLLSPKN
jgi:hypothetical protein